MSNINSHIKQYLDYYSKSESSLGYALLLQGEWGCGKTWFIKNYINNYVDSSGKANPFLYISLYGISSLAEIDEQLFQLLHPVLSSKPVVLTGKILKGILRTGLKVDWDGDNKIDGTINSQIPDIDLQDLLNKANNRIIVFDDLERSGLTIKSLLGYINSFVEHQGLKVIILANEKELEINKDEFNVYKRIKEKIIGKSYKVNIDLDSAFNSFTKNITDRETRKLLEENILTIEDIFSLAEFGNLRHLQQSFWEFERFYRNVNKKHKESAALTKELLSLFLAFSIEIKGGKITPADINKLSSISRLAFGNEDRDESQVTPIEKVVNKYNFINYYNPILTQRSWSKFFEEGFLSEAEITESLDKSRYFQGESAPDWQRLWHFNDLEDYEFEDIMKRVMEQWKNQAFTNPGVILHICGLYLRFSGAGLYSLKRSEVVEDCKNYIKALRDKSAFTDIENIRLVSIDRDQWAGLGYAFYDTKEFQEIYQYLIGAIDQVKINALPEAGQELLKVMSDDTDKFCRMITQNNIDEAIYYNTPIFHYINAEQFIASFLTLESPKRRQVFIAFGDRYTHRHISEQLVSELDFLLRVDTLLSDEIRKKTGKLSAYLFEAFRNNYLHKSITLLRKIKKEVQDASSQKTSS